MTIRRRGVLPSWSARRRQRASRIWQAGVSCLLVLFALDSSAHAACNLIPGTAKSFRSTLGAVDRPFAGPGDWVRLSLGSTCFPKRCFDGTSAGDACQSDVQCPSSSCGFSSLPEDHVITLVFAAPDGSTSLVVLAADCGAVENQLSACRAEETTIAVCQPISTSNLGEPPIALATRTTATGTDLMFRFPDTDAYLDAAGDDRTFAGPVTIVVTKVGDPIACELTSKTCQDVDPSQLIACVDVLHEDVSTCGSPLPPHSLFASFTALPPPNDYQALCFAPQPLCNPTAPEVRMTTDAAGNLLVPMDWRGILIGDDVPVARLLHGSLVQPACGATDACATPAQSIVIPGDKFLAAFSPEGGLLPPVFDPQSAPATADTTTLFGSADAPRTVLRVARRSSIFKACTGGEHDGIPCMEASDCPQGTCDTATCAGGAQRARRCVSDAQCPQSECGPALFDLGGGALAGSGLIVLAREVDGSTPGLCQAGVNAGGACMSNSDCAQSTCVGYALRALDPAPLDGLAQTDDISAFVLRESIDEQDLNDDGDVSDDVVVLTDRRTGITSPIGRDQAVGVAVSRIHQAPFTVPVVALHGDALAFLEPEPLQGNCRQSRNACDKNRDGDLLDTILRFYSLTPDGALDMLPGTTFAVDAEPMIDGASLALDDELLVFRVAEAANAVQRTLCVSESSLGEQVSDAGLFGKAITPDGRHVTFSSFDALVPDDLNESEDIYVRDLFTDTTSRVSVSSAGEESDGPSMSPSISADGRYVAFESEGTNLVADDTNGIPDVFVHDRLTARTMRVSVRSTGEQAIEGPREFPYGRFPLGTALSGDGKYVAFGTFAYNLGEEEPAADDCCSDVVVHDRDADVDGVLDEAGGRRTIQITHAEHPVPPYLEDFGGMDPRLSADGRFVAFHSGGGVPLVKVLLYDRDADTDGVLDQAGTVAVTELSQGVGGDAQHASEGSLSPDLSADGRRCAFQSDADNLVAGDTNGDTDIFWVNAASTVAGTARSSLVERVSTTSQGTQAVDGFDGFYSKAGISADGRYVLFPTGKTLTSDDKAAPGLLDVFLHDTLTGLTSLVSVDSSGKQHNFEIGGSEILFAPVVSGGGRQAVFESTAFGTGDLAEGDPLNWCGLIVRGPMPDDFLADVTGDGDIDDTLLTVLDRAHGQFTSLGPATRASVDDSRVAFLASESQRDAGGLSVAAPHETARIYDLSSVESKVYVPNRGLIAGITVGCVDLQHTWLGDLTIELVSPSGTTAVLFDRRGQDSDGLQCTTFSDSAALSLADSAAPYRGPHRPETPLTVFEGEEARGEWTLRVTDSATPDDGTLLTWNLTIVSDDTASADLNGDGDANDEVVHVYSGDRGNQTLNLGRAATTVMLSDAILAATISERSDGDVDLNGDGDTSDQVVAVHGVGGGSGWTDLAVAARDAELSGGMLALLVSERQQGSIDLNADGDAEDDVLHVYDTFTGELRNIGQAATDFVMAGGAIAFRTAEHAQGNHSLNGDGDTEDEVLQFHAYAANRTVNTGLAATPCRLEACDPRQPYRLVGETIRFLTLETDQGEDLNGDGDTDDLVLSLFNTAMALRNDGGSLVAGDPSHGWRRTSVAGAAVHAGPISVVAQVVTGVCSSSGYACSNDAECGGSVCFLPPGGCIETTAIPCNPKLEETGCSEDQFCQPLLGQPEQGICKRVQTLSDGTPRPCSSDTDCAPCDTCSAPPTCNDDGTVVARHSNPFGVDGQLAFASGGRCVDELDRREYGTCATADDCPPGSRCEAKVAVVAGADSDADDLPDELDNCPRCANADQLDSDANGTGDACEVACCGNGTLESDEECDDGNTVAEDGCDSDCSIELVTTTTTLPVPSCSQPFSSAESPIATDCLYILEAGIGLRTCVPECECNTNGQGDIGAIDALLCLRFVIGDPVTLQCPPPCVVTP